MRPQLGFAIVLLSLLHPVQATATKSTGGGARSTPIVIEYYGDSTVWGYKSVEGGQVPVPAPSAFADALAGGTKYEVRNQGVNGSTACGLLRGADGKHPPWDLQMAKSKARYVLLNHAINDQWKHTLTEYKSCLQSLARIARRNGKKIIFETPNPTRDSGKDGLDVYVDAMKSVALAEAVPVIDQYAYLNAYLKGGDPHAICPDGLHPSEAIYVMKGRFAAKVFMDLVNGK